MKTLLFIESINPTRTEGRYADNMEKRFSICMEDVKQSLQFYDFLNLKEDGEKYYNSNDFNPYHIFELTAEEMVLNTGTKLYEGMFVYVEETDNGLLFTSGTWDPMAQELIRSNSRLRHNILDKNTDSIRIIDGFNYDDSCVCAKSYHINVGNGNCTFILFFNTKSSYYRLWMVDCGMVDTITHKNYKANIDIAIQKVAEELGCNTVDIRIHRLLLTHWHADHYNGINYLLTKGLIDVNTEFVMNLYYSCPTVCANNLLTQLDGMNVRCYEPQVSLQMPNCKILYPNQRIGRWHNTLQNMIGITKVNNSSVVYSIGSTNKNMIFPGDLEKQGFDRMTKAHTCRYCLYTSTYYCVSHHASLTGHINLRCLSGPCRIILDCVKHGLQYAIVMGRDGAYNGIYNAQVISDFCKSIVYSEKDNRGKMTRGFILEWKTAKVTYIY